jgi:type IV pilus assembly protein PilC
LAQSSAVVAGDAKRTFGQQLRGFLKYESGGKIKPQEIVLFCRQLASFVRVGIPVITAIQTFGEQATNEKLRNVYTAVAADLERGSRLSEAFSRHPAVFPQILLDMVRSAEVSGNLDQVLRQAAKHIERERAARQKVKSAMTYPVIIASVAVVVAVGIVVFVLPQFRNLYQSLNVPLPGIMAALLNLSAFVSGHALILVAAVLAIVVAFGFWIRTDQGRYRLDAFALRLPFVSALIKASTTERFCRSLGDMLSAGVPMGQTYAVVLANVRNRVFRRALDTVGPALAAGRGIYRPLQESAVFAPAVVQMIRVGEETGHLDTNLVECADMYEEELDYRIKRMTAILEPALIVFVGVIVGFVAVTLVTSIYSLAGGFH